MWVSFTCLILWRHHYHDSNSFLLTIDIVITLTTSGRTWKVFGTELVAMVTFQTSGYHKIRVELGNKDELEKIEELFLFVRSVVSNVRISTEEKSLEVREVFRGPTISFGKGTNVTVDVEVKVNGETVHDLSFNGGKLF